MKRLLFLLIVSIFFMAEVSIADQIVIPLETDEWITVTKDGSGTFEEVSDGLKFSNINYRTWGIAASVATADLTDASVRYKWKVEGGNNTGSQGDYMGVWTGVGFSDESIFKHRFSLSAIQTTHHSYNGSIVLEQNVWYYSLINISPDRQYTISVSTDNYIDYGGASFQEISGEVATEDWDKMSNAQLIWAYNDNYQGPDAFMILGEASYSSSAPTPSTVPEPTTAILFSIGLLSIVGISRSKS